MQLDAVIVTLATLVAAAAGAILSNWYSRSRPWVGLSAVERDDRDLVAVPAELRQSLESCHWARHVAEDAVPLRNLIALLREAESDIPILKSSLATLSAFQNAGAPSPTELEANRSRLTTLIEDRYFFLSLCGMLRRNSLPLPAEAEVVETTPLIEAADLTHDKDQCVFMLETPKAKLMLDPGKAPVSTERVEHTRTLGRILQFWIEPYLSHVVAAVRDEMQHDLQTLLEIREQVRDLVSSRRLLVTAKIVNTGGRPLHIKPFGVLQVRSGGKPIKPLPVVIESYRPQDADSVDFDRMIGLIEGMATKQGVRTARTPSRDKDIPEYVIVKPGEIVNVESVTIEALDDESIVAALETGMLSARLTFERAGEGARRWIRTAPLVMGVTQNAEDRRRLLEQAERSSW